MGGGHKKGPSQEEESLPPPTKMGELHPRTYLGAGLDAGGGEDEEGAVLLPGVSRGVL